MNAKKLLTTLVAIVLVVVGAVWFLSDGMEHIEDTNGLEDFSLQSITEQQIIDLSTGSVGGPSISKGILTGDAVEFSAEKFSGVYEVLYDNFIGKSDFQLDLTNFVVNGGNFALVVVHDDQIVATLEPDMFVTYRMDDINGYVSLRIVGESADFSFSMAQIDYDYHSHP